jgi:hypothetical protein
LRIQEAEGTQGTQGTQDERAGSRADFFSSENKAAAEKREVRLLSLFLSLTLSLSHTHTERYVPHREREMCHTHKERDRCATHTHTEREMWHMYVPHSLDAPIFFCRRIRLPLRNARCRFREKREQLKAKRE